MTLYSDPPPPTPGPLRDPLCLSLSLFRRPSVTSAPLSHAFLYPRCYSADRHLLVSGLRHARPVFSPAFKALLFSSPLLLVNCTSHLTLLPYLYLLPPPILADSPDASSATLFNLSPTPSFSLSSAFLEG